MCPVYFVTHVPGLHRATGFFGASRRELLRRQRLHFRTLFDQKKSRCIGFLRDQVIPDELRFWNFKTLASWRFKLFLIRF